MRRAALSTIALLVAAAVAFAASPASAAKPKPEITFNLAGRTFTSKEKVRMSGEIDPATHAETVTLHVQRYDKDDDVWRNYDENVTKSDIDGSFRYRHSALPKGKYRARAEVGRTSDHRAGRNRWKVYAVRRRNF
jgi:hypothetical protein